MKSHEFVSTSFIQTAINEAFLKPFVSTQDVNNGSDFDDPQMSLESNRNESSIQYINRKLSSSLSLPRMLVNSYTPPYLNETNDDILSPDFSQELNSTNPTKDIFQKSDQSLQSFHTPKSNVNSNSSKDNDLSLSSSHSVSSLSSFKETSNVSSTVIINTPNSDNENIIIDQTSDSLLAVDHSICSMLENSLKETVSHATSKSCQNSDITFEKKPSDVICSPLSSSTVHKDTTQNSGSHHKHSKLSKTSINSPKSRNENVIFDQTSDSLPAIDYSICSDVVNSLKDTVSHATSKYYQKSDTIVEEKQSDVICSPLSSSIVHKDTTQNSGSHHENSQLSKSFTQLSNSDNMALDSTSSQLCMPCDGQPKESNQMSDSQNNRNDVPQHMKPKIHDKETLSQATERLFFKGQAWPSLHQLRIHAEYFASYWGFVVVRDGMRIACNRFGSVQKRKDRPNKGLRKSKISMKCNCPWIIRFQFIQNDESQTSDIEGKNRPVKIQKVVSNHANGCKPGINQYTWCKTKAGHYTNETSLVLRHLVSYMILKPNGFADASLIRSYMRKVLPSRKSISSQEVYNVRVRAKLLMKQISAEGKTLETFDFKPDIQKQLFTPLDDITDDFLDEAAKSAKDVFYDFLNDDQCSFKLFKYLENLADIDVGFSYNISRNDKGELTGFAWMTSVMRSNFERYHSVIFLDAMKRRTNVHLWPYMSVVIVNDLGESQPVCESVMMSEVNAAYTFLLQSSFKMCPKVKPNHIKVVFGDEFFNQNLIQTSGLSEAKMFYDHYHLVLNQEKLLGPSIFQKTKLSLRSLLNATSHERFVSIRNDILSKFPNYPKLTELLNKYSKIEHMIAAYSIDSTQGSFQRRGSAPSEQNHWSVVSWIGPNFTGELTQLLMVLLERHSHKCTLSNEKLNRLHNERSTMIYKLKNDLPYSEELKSAETLNRRGHDLFLKLVLESQNYVHKKTDDGNHLIYRVGYETSPRIFKSLDERCSCVDRVANMKQCVHEFVLTHKFQPTYWSNIYTHRDCLTRSQFIGDYKNPRFTYQGDSTECIMISHDVGVMEDFQMKEIESTDVSEKKQSIKNNQESDDSVSSIPQNLISCQNQRQNMVLNHSEFMDVASKLSNSIRRNKKYANPVCAMMIQMLDLCDGKTVSNINVYSEANVDEQFSSILRNYKSSFKSFTEVSTKDKSYTKMPGKVSGYQYASSKRLIPSVETLKKENRKNTNKVRQSIAIPAPPESSKKILTCSFCQGKHQITQCPLKESYGDTKNGTELVKYLLKSCPYTIISNSEKQRLISTDVSCKAGIKHVIVYILHSKISIYSSNERPTEDELAVTVSFLDSYGKEIPGYNRCLLDFSKFTEYIYKHQKKRGRYIFSKTNEECVGSNFVNNNHVITSPWQNKQTFVSAPPQNPYVQNINIQNRNKRTIIPSTSSSYPNVGRSLSTYPPNKGDVSTIMVPSTYNNSIQNSVTTHMVPETSSKFPELNSYVPKYHPGRSTSILPMTQPLTQSNIVPMKQNSVPYQSNTLPMKNNFSRLNMTQPTLKSSHFSPYKSSPPYAPPNETQKSVNLNNSPYAIHIYDNEQKEKYSMTNHCNQIQSKHQQKSVLSQPEPTSSLSNNYKNITMNEQINERKRPHVNDLPKCLQQNSETTKSSIKKPKKSI